MLTIRQTKIILSALNYLIDRIKNGGFVKFIDTEEEITKEELQAIINKLTGE